MAWWGQDPVAEGQAIATASAGIAKSLQDIRHQELLRQAFDAAKKLFFDQAFTPTSVADLTSASEEQRKNMEVILSLPPELQQKVWDAVAAFRAAIGKQVPQAVRERLAQIGVIDATQPDAKQKVMANLLAAAGQSPTWAAENVKLLDALRQMGEKVGAEYMTLSPGSGVYDPVSGQMKTVLDDPSKMIKEVSAGATLYDIRSGSPIYTAPKPEDEKEVWGPPEKVPGLPGYYQRNATTGALKQIDYNEAINSAKDAILRLYGVSDLEGLNPDLKYTVSSAFERAEKYMRDKGMGPLEAARAAVADVSPSGDIAKPVPPRERLPFGLKKTSLEDAAATLAVELQKAKQVGRPIKTSELVTELTQRGYAEDEARQIVRDALELVQ